MKKFSILILLVVFATTVNTSCSKSDSNSDNPLVGTWEMTDGTFTLEFTFSSNNTGSYTATEVGEVPESSNFSYTISDNNLTITMNGETDYATFSVSGSTLTIVIDGETLVFTKK